MFINLIIKSTNKHSLNKIKYFIYKTFSKQKNKNILYIRQIYNKNNKNMIFLLKSPHVNNKSVECLGFNNYSNKFYIYSYNYKKLFLLLKKFNNFSDVNVKIIFFLNKRKGLKKNFFLNTIHNYRKGKYKNYLKMYDILGESYYVSHKIYL